MHHLFFKESWSIKGGSLFLFINVFTVLDLTVSYIVRDCALTMQGMLIYKGPSPMPNYWAEI